MILTNKYVQIGILVLIVLAAFGATYVAGRVDQHKVEKAKSAITELKGVEKHEATKRTVNRMAVPELDSVLGNWMQ